MSAAANPSMDGFMAPLPAPVPMTGAVADEAAIIPVDAGRAAPHRAGFDGEELATARRYADASRAASTRRAYAADWRRFAAWCFSRGLETLPADPRTVAVFLSAEATAGAAPPTAGRRLAAIGWMHRRAGSMATGYTDPFGDKAALHANTRGRATPAMLIYYLGLPTS